MTGLGNLGPVRITCACRTDYCRHYRAIRAEWAPYVAAGLASCWRCSEPIKPDEPWDAGHSDDDRTLLMGPEHRRENRATASRRKNRAPHVPAQGRRWVL